MQENIICDHKTLNTLFENIICDHMKFSDITEMDPCYGVKMDSWYINYNKEYPPCGSLCF